VGILDSLPSRGTPGLPPVRSLIKTLREDAHSWEIISPAILPSGYPPGWLHQLKFVNIFVLPYIIIILLARSKSMTIEKCEIKYEKNTIPCKASTAVDPAKRDLERTRIESVVLDFRPEAERALPAHRGLIGLIGLPFWEHAASRCTHRRLACSSPGDWGLRACAGV
jgi:hypothetical protein